MKNKLEYPIVFFIGASGYGTMELLFRGHTHWTMYILGGLCLCLVYAISNYSGLTMPEKWLICTVAITGAEFFAGGLVNLTLRWEVWTYSQYPMNILGQVCPVFSLLWLLICIPVCPLCIKLSYAFKTQPYKETQKYAAGILEEDAKSGQGLRGAPPAQVGDNIFPDYRYEYGLYGNHDCGLNKSCGYQGYQTDIVEEMYEQSICRNSKNNVVYESRNKRNSDCSPLGGGRLAVEDEPPYCAGQKGVEGEKGIECPCRE